MPAMYVIIVNLSLLANCTLLYQVFEAVQIYCKLLHNLSTILVYWNIRVEEWPRFHSYNSYIWVYMGKYGY